jgi:hypothetical protein
MDRLPEGKKTTSEDEGVLNQAFQKRDKHSCSLAKLAVSMGETFMLDDLPLVVKELVKCDLTCCGD